MAETYGEAIGELIRKKRLLGGFTLLSLALEAFEDESKIRRIVELENGQVARPQWKTIQPLAETLNITESELERCRTLPTVRPQERNKLKLSRNLIERLANMFEIDAPEASTTNLHTFLAEKAQEWRELRTKLGALKHEKRNLSNQLAAAEEAIEQGRFEEADQILTGAEELQNERVLAEARLLSQLRFTKAQAALLQNDIDRAFTHFKSSINFLLSFDRFEAAELRRDAYLILYRHSLKVKGPSQHYTENLIRKNLAFYKQEKADEKWALSLSNLGAALQARGSVTYGDDGFALFSQSEKAYRDSLAIYGKRSHPDDWARVQNNLGLVLHEQADRFPSTRREALFGDAIDAFTKSLEIRTESADKLNWAQTKNNRAAAIVDRVKHFSNKYMNKEIDQVLREYLDVLKIRKKILSPELWAETKFNQGVALRIYGERSCGMKRVRLYKRSLVCFRAALKLRTREERPYDWARTQKNLGDLCISWVDALRADQKKSSVESAIEYYERAMQIFDTDDTSYRFKTCFEAHQRAAKRLASLTMSK